MEAHVVACLGTATGEEGGYDQLDGSWLKEKATHIPEKMFDIVGVEPHLGSGMRGSAGRRWALGARPHKRGNGTMQVDRPRWGGGSKAVSAITHLDGSRVSQALHRSTGESRLPFGSRYQRLRAGCVRWRETILLSSSLRPEPAKGGSGVQGTP